MGIEWEEVTVERNVHDFQETPMIVGVLKEKVQSIFQGDDYVLSVADGDDVTVYGRTILHRKMEDVELGTVVRITSLGLKKSKLNPGNAYEDFKVEKAKPDTTGGEGVETNTQVQKS